MQAKLAFRFTTLSSVDMFAQQISASSNLFPLAGAAGVVIHQALKRFSIDLYPFTTVSVVIAVHWALLGHFYRFDEYTLWEANQRAFMLVGFTLASLATNILVYRAFFHRLRHFPGPFGAKLSKFWALWQVIESKARYYQVTQRLHEEYGDYVRTGIYNPQYIVLYFKTEKSNFYIIIQVLARSALLTQLLFNRFMD